MGPNFDDVDSFGSLKELYAEDSRFQEHIQHSLYNFCDHAGEGEVEYDGKYWNVDLGLQLNESFGARLDDERLPDPDQPKNVFAKYRVKLMYAQLEATVFAATRGHKGGRVNGKYMDDYVKGTLLSFMSNIDFDFYGNGRGYRATVESATGAAASFVVDFSTRLRPGAKLDWYDPTLATKRGSIKIAVKGIDRVNRTVYIDSTFGTGAVPSGAGADDILVVYGALDPNEPSDGRHVCGLDRITDNSVSLGGVSPSDYAVWSATNLGANGANPNQELLQQHIDQIYNISGMYPNKMVFNTSWKRGYLLPFLSQRQFTSNNFDTGASSLTFDAVKMGQDSKRAKPKKMDMLEDKNCDPTKVYVWVNDAFCIATDYSDTPHLADEDGQEFRIRQGYDAMAGYYRFWANTVTYQRNAIGVQSDYDTVDGVI